MKFWIFLDEDWDYEERTNLEIFLFSAPDDFVFGLDTITEYLDYRNIKYVHKISNGMKYEEVYFNPKQIFGVCIYSHCQLFDTNKKDRDIYIAWLETKGVIRVIPNMIGEDI